MEVKSEGRPKNRWTDEVINDIKELKLRYWSQIVKDRKAWNDPVQKTQTHVGLWWLKKEIYYEV
jgi:hypothetical protein